MSESAGDGEGVNILGLGIDSGAVEQGVRRVEGELERLARSADVTAEFWDGLLEGFDETGRAAQEAGTVLRQLAQQAETAGDRNRRLAAEVWEQARAMAAARQAAMATQQSLEGYMEAAQRATRYQAELNERLGVRPAMEPELYRRRAEDVAAYGRELDNLRAKFNPLYAAGQQYRQGLEEIRQAQRVGAISAAEAAAAQERLKAATQAQVAALRGVAAASGPAATGARLTAFEMTNLSYQLQDVVAQLGSGTSPFVILAQQGPQAASAVGGVGNAMRLLGSLITPFRLGLGVAAAGATTFAVAMAVVESRLTEASVKLRATRDDYAETALRVTAAARQVAASGGISAGDAREAGVTLLGGRSFESSGASLTETIRLAGDLARVMGVEVPAAAATLKKALDDPGEAARELARTGMFGFNDALRRNIELLQAQGRSGEAARLVLDQYYRRVAGAAEEVNPLVRVWRDVRDAIQEALGNVGAYLEKQSQIMRRGGGATLEDYGGSFPDIGPGSAARQAERAAGPPPQPSIAGVPLVPELAALGVSGGRLAQRDVEAAIRAQATALGLPPDFAAAIARRESGFNQTNAQGGILTSPRGALGIMQLMPGTAAELGVDPTNPRQNIVGGLRYLSQLSQSPLVRSGDGAVDWSRVAAAYNAGPGRFAQFATEGRGLPQETLAYVAAVTGGSGSLGGAAGRIGAADSVIRGQDFRSDRLGVLSGQRDTLQAALASPELDQASEAATRYREALEKVRAEIEALEDPVERQQRLARQQVAAYAETAGAARELAEAERQAQEAARSAGKNDAEVVLAGLEARSVAQQRLTGELDDMVAAMALSSKAQRDEAEATMLGAQAAAEAAERRRAEIEALRYGAAGTDEYKVAVERLTAAYQEQRAGAADLATARQALATKEQIETLERERDLIGATADQRERELAALRQRQAIIRAGGDPNSDVSKSTVALAQQQASLTLEVKRSTQAYEEMGNILPNAFDRVWTAVVQGAAQGTLATVRFGSIVKATMLSVLSDLAKYALVNPIANGLFGQDRPTAFDAGGLLGGIFGFLGSGTSGGGASSASQAVAGGGIGLLGGGLSGGASPQRGGSGGSLFDTGSNLLSVLRSGQSLFGGSGGGLGGLFGATGDTIATGIANLGVGQGALDALGIAAYQGPTLSGAPLSGFGFSGGGLGGAVSAALPWIGGIGGGFAAGSLVGNLVQSATGRTGPGPLIGAGGGAVAGAAIGSIIPGVGTLIGGLIGGVVGGAGGGFFGASKKGLEARSGGAVYYAPDESGRLQIIGTEGKRWDAAGTAASVQERLTEINQATQDRGLYFTSEGWDQYGVGQVAVGKAPGPNAPREISSEALLRSLRPGPDSGENVPIVLRALQERGGTLEQALNEIDWTRDVYEPLLRAIEPAKAFNDSLGEIAATFDPVISKARDLGLATDALTAAYEKQQQAVWDARNQRVSELTGGVEVRRLRVANDNQAADLLTYDIAASGERLTYRANLEQLAVDAAEVTRRMVELEQVQASERLAIQQRYADQAKAIEEQRQQQAEATVLSGIASLTDYARSLRYSDAAPISPVQRLSAASRDFDAAAAAAATGDWTSIANLPGLADTLLSASRAVNGSTIGYTRDYERVIAALDSVTQQPANVLTASVLQAETRTQTETLTRKLDELIEEVAALRAETRQSADTPLRLVA